MLTWFCPNCWESIPEDGSRCPSCGYRLSEYASLSYDEKLLLGLSHRIRENRLAAVSILGERRVERALPIFEHLLENDPDVYVVREIVRALYRFQSEYATRLRVKATGHRAKMVRQAARAALHYDDGQNLEGRAEARQ